MEKQKIPIYDAVLSESDYGIFAISFVSAPATETEWSLYSKEDSQKYSIVDEEQHKICAVVMRADYNILRRDSNGELFYIRFSRETLEELAQRMLKNNTQNIVDLEHDHNLFIWGAEMIELFIKDSAKGISPKGFEEIEEGSLFCTYKIVDDALWKTIKAGDFHGLSIECQHGARPEEHKEENLEDIWEIIRQIKL